MEEQTPQTTTDDFFFGSLPVGYVAVRKDGVITQLNQALSHSLQYDRADLIGRMAADFPFDEPNRRLFSEQMAQRAHGVTGAYALHLRSRGNTRLPVGVFAVPQFDGRGVFWGSRGILVPFDRMHELVQPGLEAAEDALLHVTNGQGSPSVAPDSAPLIGTYTPTDNPMLAQLMPKLTKRERDVVALLLVGLRVNGVAERLELSHYTVRNHLKRIFRKAGVNSQGQLLLKLNAMS